MTRTDRRRFPILFAAIAALAVVGAVLASLFSTAEAQTEKTNFYLWRTTLTVGEDSGTLGYDDSESLGSISTDADFGYAPWNPPHKHHVDRESYYTVEAIKSYDDDGSTVLEVNFSGAEKIAEKVKNGPGNVTLWLNHTAYPVSVSGASLNTLQFRTRFDDTPDVTWAEDDEVKVALVYERQTPSAPTNVSVTAPPGEEGTLEVSWDEADDGTFPIECYLVEFRHPSGEARDRKQSYPGSLGTGKGCGDSPPTSVKRTDLEPGTEYQVLVQALSGDGYGDWSETKTVRTNGIPTRCVLNPGDLWCGVVTVERSTDSFGADSFGYNNQVTPTVGDLSDDDFDVGTDSYTINLISVGSSTAVTPGALDITLSDRLSAAERGNLVLHIGGAAFKLSEATVSGPSLRWADAGLDWSRKEYVIMRLREDSSDRSDDSSGQKKQSEEPGSAPDKPTGLSATATHDRVVLTWDDPGDDTITGYVILRRVRVNDTGGEFSELVPDTGSAATTYTDDTVAAETTYTYRIKAINEHGTSERSRWYHIDTPAAPASKPAVADGPPGLAPNAPNPFNANTLIPYRLDADGPVRLEIYNLLGQPVRTLVNQYQDAGFYKVRWDARDQRGALVSAGMYLVRLHYPGGVQTQRLLYLK